MTNFAHPLPKQPPAEPEPINPPAAADQRESTEAADAARQPADPAQELVPDGDAPAPEAPAEPLMPDEATAPGGAESPSDQPMPDSDETSLQTIAPPFDAARITVEVPPDAPAEPSPTTEPEATLDSESSVPTAEVLSDYAETPPGRFEIPEAPVLPEPENLGVSDVAPASLVEGFNAGWYWREGEKSHRPTKPVVEAAAVADFEEDFGLGQRGNFVQRAHASLRMRSLPPVSGSQGFLRERDEVPADRVPGESATEPQSGWLGGLIKEREEAAARTPAEQRPNRLGGLVKEREEVAAELAPPPSARRAGLPFLREREAIDFESGY